MNWLGVAFIISMPSSMNSLSPHEAMGEPGMFAASRYRRAAGVFSSTRPSTSTGVLQSRSLSLLHWEVAARLYRVTSWLRERSYCHKKMCWEWSSTFLNASCISALEGKPTGSAVVDRESTPLNSTHLVISYAVFCLKKKKKQKNQRHIRDLQSEVRLAHQPQSDV